MAQGTEHSTKAKSASSSGFMINYSFTRGRYLTSSHLSFLVCQMGIVILAS